MTDWRQWLEELEQRAAACSRAWDSFGRYQGSVRMVKADVPQLIEGYRLLAEAVEAKAELNEAVNEYVKARKSPLQIDPERTNALGQRGIEMQTRYHQAQAKALAHLRGVGRD